MLSLSGNYFGEDKIKLDNRLCERIVAIFTISKHKNLQTSKDSSPFCWGTTEHNTFECTEF